MRYLIYLIIFMVASCSSDNSNSGINPLPNFDAMWDFSYPDSTEIRFKEILPLLTQTSEFSVSADYHAELLTQIARAQGLQGKFNEASASLARADSIITDKMPVAKIRYLLEKGRLFNTMNQKDEAVKLFLQAYDLGKQDSLDFYALDAAHMMGIVSPVNEQLDWSLKALQIAETSSDLRCESWRGALYNNIAWTYFDKKDYLHAHKMFLKSFEWYEDNNNAEASRIARWAIARCLRSLFRFEEALHIQLNLEQEMVENNLAPDVFVYEELAELFLATNNRSKAKEYAEKAIDMLNKDDLSNESRNMRLERLKTLSSK